MSQAPTIMLIRHAEKAIPQKEGVDESGADDSHSLAVRGWQRAGALVSLFAPLDRPLPDARLVRPAHLFAECADAPDSEPKKSQREEQTLAPLADMLSLEPSFAFGRGQETEAAEAAKNCSGPVLIAWEHKSILKLASAITGSQTLPEEWPSDRFDMVLVFNRQAEDGSYTLEQVPQLLLAGDTARQIVN